MKIAFRNFLTTLRRYKISSLLNVIGLTLAFTAFYVIMTQVWWELGYNRSLHEADRIYLVENEDWYEPGKWSSWLNRPVPERVIASTAGVEVGGCMWGGFGSGTCWTSNEPSFGYNKFSASCGSVSLPFLDVFAFRSVEGDVHDIGKPKSVIVSREAAERMRVGVGSLIWVDTDEPQPDGAMEVVAVFEDFPDNSLLGECEVVKNLGETNLYTTSEWSFNYFVKFRPGADPDEFARQWTNVNQEMQREAAEKRAAAGDAADDDDESGIYGVRLSPVSDLYFESDSQAPCRQGSVVTTYTLLGIAVLVIVLAFINFVNFFFALVPVRIRTVNTFKVFGAPASSLRFNFVFEAFGLVLIALLAAWYVSFALQGTEFASYISASLALSQNLEVVGLVAVVAFVMALAASLYPAWYITSFAPALVVKGSFGGNPAARRVVANTYGYASSGESFSIVDPEEAWIMELIGKGYKDDGKGGNARKGIVWVARRIPDGYVSAHANQARITTFPKDDPENCLYSPDVVAFAREMGYYDGTDEDFSFCEAYAPADFGALRGCEARVWAFFRTVADGMDKYVDYAMGHNAENRMPLWVKPRTKVSPKVVFDCMRDHYEGTPMDMTTDIGAGGSACPYRWRPMYFEVDGVEYCNERATATQQTGFWFVAQARPPVPAQKSRPPFM